MASVNDVGVPGQPATNLTAWQAAIRDALNGSDVPVDTRISTAVARVDSTITPYTGWASAGGAFAGLLATRHGGMVTVEGVFSCTAGQSMTAGAAYQIGTVPAGFRPTATRSVAAYIYVSGTTSVLAQVTVDTAGAVRVSPVSAVTVVAGTSSVGMNLTYRQGN